MTIAFSFGKWGGFYWKRGNTWRLCLGWAAITIMFFDIDELFNIVSKVAKKVEELDQAVQKTKEEGTHE